MRKFFSDFEYIEGMDTITVQDDEAKHILKVLRFKIGDKLIVSNYSGNSFECEIVDISIKSCSMKLLNSIDITNKSNINISIFQGYPKGDKLELITQKLTEIGVREITPIITNRVDLKINLDKFRLDRLIRISKEACKQCGISDIPKINIPVKLDEILFDTMEKFDMIIVLYEIEVRGLKEVFKEVKNIKNIAVFIGPEGGFEKSEVDYIKSFGAYSLSLGQRILRTETATILISSILQYEFGDIS